MAKTGKKIGGISANSLVLPIVVILSILHIAIISLIMAINTSSSSLSRIMQNAGSYTQEATSLLAGSSLLSETATNFVLLPIAENGEINVGPLNAYVQELGNDRRGSQILAKFQEYDVDPQAVELIAQAAESAQYMLNAQIHAITLMRSVYSLPEVTFLKALPAAELTEEEMAMGDAQKKVTHGQA